ncbi:ATP synthase protein I [Natronocella acetinitrilica]|uniref:ATP synthase protein I n=1 Tax=Natronocella acetinitrilica TaxID=414046 RepID=A0AAE3G0S6_9GAMM|nr:ATP synthase subunit I [Natronocella acetinitrilica]MCP1673380.1 ATP synthase protein I [Natronocella acetinitrilica]
METKRVLGVLFSTQASVTVLGAAVWWALVDSWHGLAAVGGGIAVMFPTLIFAAIVFSVSPDAPPKRILGAFYRGEAIKIGATVLMLVVLLQWFSTTPLPLLTTYILAILLYWPALLVGVGRRPR